MFKFLSQEQFEFLDSFCECPPHQDAVHWIASKFRVLFPTLSQAEKKLRPLIDVRYLEVDIDGRNASVTDYGRIAMNLRLVLKNTLSILEKSNGYPSSMDILKNLEMEIYKIEEYLDNLESMGLIRLKKYSSHTFEGLSESIHVEKITNKGMNGSCLFC